MIRKININNFAVFNNFEWSQSVTDSNGKSVSCSDINIIYGRNYSGKTTLSRIIRSLETGNLSDKFENPIFTIQLSDKSTLTQNDIGNCTKPIRVFNEDFVRENLRFLIDPTGEIKSIAIMGKDTIDLEDDIILLEKELGSKQEGQETGLYAQVKNNTILLQKAKTEYGRALNGLEDKLASKATNRQVGIKYQSDKFGDINYNINKLKLDITEILRHNYSPLSQDSIAELESLIKEQVKPTISIDHQLSIKLKSIISQAKELTNRKIGSSDKIQELLHNVALNDWVKRGQSLHQSRDQCAFCGNEISDDRRELLNRHFDDESRRLEGDIDNLLRHIDNEKELIVSWLKQIDSSLFYSKYLPQLSALKLEYETVSDEYFKRLDYIANQLKTRREHIINQFELIIMNDDGNIIDETTDDIASTIDKLFKQYSNIILESNNYGATLDKNKNDARKRLRLNEVYCFCSTINYLDENRRIEELKTNYEKLETSGKETIKEINDKEKLVKSKRTQQSLNNESTGAALINRYLSDFFGHKYISLEATQETDFLNASNIQFEIIRDGKKAYHLSEGECNLIAFCYYIAKLQDVDTIDSEPIVWIDDPVSSLDSNHIFFVYSIIASEILKPGRVKQFFITTHNLDFLKYLHRLKCTKNTSDGKSQEVSKGYFIINRNVKQSVVGLMPRYMKKYVTEFNYLFHEIYKCSRIVHVDDCNYSIIYNFGNNARKFLELYLYFKYPCREDEIVKYERFFGSDKVPAIFTDRINNEYSHLTVPERGGIPIDQAEIVSAAKLIIEKIKYWDSEQYDALLKAVMN